MLEVEGLESGYSAAKVLFGVSLQVRAGEVVSLMGRNGMGKSTTIKSILGICPAQGGRVVFDGQDITRSRTHRIARLGFGVVPEGRWIFSTLTVRENLVAAASNRRAVADPWTLERVFGLFPRLRERAASQARTLSGGEQQMLAIGRALMTNPRLLILDEATEGLAPVVRDQIWAVLDRLKVEGQAILIVDKNIRNLSTLASRHYVLEKGQVRWEGDSAALRRDLQRVTGLIGV